MAMASSAPGESFSASSASSTAFSVSESSSSKIGHQFVRFHQLRIELERLAQSIRWLCVEAVRADERQAEIGLRVLRIAFPALR